MSYTYAMGLYCRWASLLHMFFYVRLTCGANFWGKRKATKGDHAVEEGGQKIRKESRSRCLPHEDTVQVSFSIASRPGLHRRRPRGVTCCSGPRFHNSSPSIPVLCPCLKFRVPLTSTFSEDDSYGLLCLPYGSRPTLSYGLLCLPCGDLCCSC